MRALLLGLLSLFAGSEGERPGASLITAQVRALEVDTVGVDQRGELSLVLLESPDRTLPLAIRVALGPIEFDENRLDWSAVVDPLALQPRVRASFRAPSVPGTYEVRASVDYSVCDDQWCRRKHGELRWTVVVENQTRN